MKRCLNWPRHERWAFFGILTFGALAWIFVAVARVAVATRGPDGDGWSQSWLAFALGGIPAMGFATAGILLGIATAPMLGRRSLVTVVPASFLIYLWINV